MNRSIKTTYHPAVPVAFYLDCLPDELAKQIPRSTTYEWKSKDVTTTFGHEWYCRNQHLFLLLKEAANHKKLLQINKAMLRIIAIQKFLKKYQTQIHEKVFNAFAVMSCKLITTLHLLFIYSTYSGELGRLAT